MDLLPVPPSSTNKVNAAVNLANDGGSKSNTGYFNKRGESEEKENIDEVNLSTSNSDENEELDIDEITLMSRINEFLGKIKEFILKLFKTRKKKLHNIYK